METCLDSYYTLGLGDAVCNGGTDSSVQKLSGKDRDFEAPFLARSLGCWLSHSSSVRVKEWGRRTLPSYS